MTKNNGVATHVLSFPVILHVHVVFSTAAADICLCVGYRKLTMNLADYILLLCWTRVPTDTNARLLTVPALFFCWTTGVVGHGGMTLYFMVVLTVMDDSVCFWDLEPENHAEDASDSRYEGGHNHCVHSSDALCLQADGCTILGGIATQVISSTPTSIRKCWLTILPSYTLNAR